MAVKTENKAVEVSTVRTTIPVYLPLLPDEGGATRVDQNVVITINGVNTIVPRGVYCEVKPEVYEVLHNSGRFDRI